MLTNNEFKALSIKDQITYFQNLSEEEVSSLTSLQKEVYKKFKAGKLDPNETVEETEDEGQEEAAARFFKENPAYHLDSVFVTEKGIVYHGDMKGENAAKNSGHKYTEIKK